MFISHAYTTTQTQICAMYMYKLTLLFFLKWELGTGNWKLGTIPYHYIWETVRKRNANTLVLRIAIAITAELNRAKLNTEHRIQQGKKNFFVCSSEF